MRSEYMGFDAKRLFRVVAVPSLALLASACSSDITRFSQSYGDVTGSVAPVPVEAVGGAGMGVPYQSQAYQAPTYQAPTYQTSGDSSAYNAASSAAPRNIKPQYQEPLSQPVYQRAASSPVSAGASTLARRDGSKIVAPGDTVYSIARAHNISQQELLRANGLTSASQLQVGQRLTIPGAAQAAAGTNLMPSAATTAPKLGAAGGGYVVKSGDSLYSIARAHGLRVADIAAANNMRNGGAIQVGQTLVIPAAGSNRTAALQPKTMVDAPKDATTSRSVTSQPVVSEPAKVKAIKTKPIIEAPKKDETAAAARPADISKPSEPKQAALAKPAARASSEFRWPVRGRVISAFGEKASGRSNDGINIAVPKGTSIRAAENGVIAYAGNELEGYGNLVLVRHSDNWVTAYAHADKLLVKQGDTVKRGQVIGQAGQSGSVDSPQVHFELRRGSRPVDPLKHLSSL